MSEVTRTEIGLSGDAPGAEPDADGPLAIEGLTPGKLAWRRLKRNKVAMTALGVSVAIILLAVFTPLIEKLLDISIDGDSSLISDSGSLPKGARGGMSWDHPFGVEPGTGKDLLALLLNGARVTLLVALSATVLTVTIGVLVGTVAGAFGGWVDSVLGRFMDLVLTFPQLLLLLALSNVVVDRLVAMGFPEGNPSRILYLILALVVFGWPYIARVVRGQVISLREREFVEAAVAMGASRRRIIVRELIPNLWAPVIVYASITLPGYIAAEATLAFFNVGTDASLPTWGKLLSDSTPFFTTDPGYLLFPAGALVITVLAFNLLGDAVRDALDPRAGRV